MFHKPRSLITPVYCTRSLKGVEAKREEEREEEEERVLREEPPMLGRFSRCGSKYVLPGCLELCALFFSPLVNEPFEGRICVFSTFIFSTFVFPAGVLHSNCFLRDGTDSN